MAHRMNSLTNSLTTPLPAAAVAGLLSLLLVSMAQAAPQTVAAPALPGMHEQALEQLTIVAGEIMVLPVEGKVVRLALGSGSILSTTTVDSNLLLIAENPGATSLLIWTTRKVYSYRVTVVPKSLGDVRAKVELLTQGMKGIRLEQIGAELVLSGVAHKEALAQLSAALKGTPGLVFNVREDEGSPHTRSVLFRLHFVEVKRSLLEQIGVSWAKSATGPTLGAIGVGKSTGVYESNRQVERGDNLLDPTPPFVRYGGNRSGLFFGLATAITSRLNLGISNGDVRVLSSPELTAKSGGKARLQVGGQVPIPLSGAFGSTSVEFKPYGIILDIEPHIDADNVVTAKISTELSQIDPSVTVSGVPGFVTRNTATEVSLKGGEMIALSGLVNREMADSIDRVPALSRIPILGRLFRSDDFRNNKTELVILLEPEIIQPGDGMAQQLKQRGQDNRKHIEERLDSYDKQQLPAPAPTQVVTETDSYHGK